MAGFLNLNATLGLNASGFQIGMKRAESMAGSFAKNVKGQFAAAFGVAALVAYGRSIIKLGGDIKDMADKTGLTTDQVQAFKFGAEQAGGSIEDMATALKVLTLAQTDALAGDKARIKAFLDMGVSMDDLRSKSPEELFRKIAERIKESGLASKDLASFLLVMGKGADSIIPAMKNGIGSMVDDFQKLGLSIDEDVIAKLDAAGDEMDRLGLRAKKVTAEAGVSLFETIQDWVRYTFKGENAQDLARKRFGAPSVSKEEADAALASALRKREEQKRFNPRNFMGGEGSGALDAYGKPWGGGDRLHLMRRNPLEFVGPQLNNWQRLGGATRDNSTMTFKSIEKNTADTARATGQMATRGNFGADQGGGVIFE